MRLPRLLLAILGSLFLAGSLASVPFPSGSTASAQTSPPSGITVAISQTNASLKAGDSFTFTSTIRNSSNQPTPRLIATLNLVSVGLDAYVDPEDWSPDRFRSIDSILPSSSNEQSWEVHAIQGGDYSIFIVVLPDTASLTDVSVVGGPPVHLHVDLQRNLNPGGTLPVALAVPAFLAMVLAGTKLLTGRARKVRS